jgi:trans-2,3-dihydro-3-hydroxyanthranilate isomerase
MATKLDYALVDVFAEHALEGNMLALFTDARGLTTGQMQALARETNLSETAFILPDESPAVMAEEGVHVRIFTTEEELPFAGHPTLGTAAWLHLHHPALRGLAEIRLRLSAGVVPVRFESSGPDTAGIFATMRQPDPVFGATHAHDQVASALGVPLDALDLGRPVQTVSTGVPFCIVSFRSVEALGTLAPAPARTRAWLDRSDAKFFFCMAPVAAGDTLFQDRPADFHNRMQFYNGEDPATGAASGCAISYLVRHGFVASGQKKVFRQGLEMGRPSRIQVSASLIENTVSDVFVGGRTIPVAEGRFFLR